MEKKKQVLKVIFYNFFILLVITIFFEIFFGYWFKDENFGIYIRDQRNVERKFDINHYGQNYRYTFKRNSLGFIGDEIDPKKIRIVFEGGSTGEQQFTPPEFRIVDQLNLFLKKDKINLKIVNASKGGKTTRGYYNDFTSWFPKIKNFKPEIFIFYTGHNDASLKLPKHFDNVRRDSYFDQLEDYIKNNSISYEIKVKIQNRYFGKIRTNYGLYEKDLYKNYVFIDYEKAKKKFNLYNLNNEELNLLDNFKKNLSNLDKEIIQSNVVPIFITQIRFDGISTKTLYIINETLKEFCETRNYHIIKLDEVVKNFEKDDFYDKIHTGINGSKKISKIIYPKLKEILINH